MPSFTKYATLAGSNAGALMKVFDPTGKETDDWIKVRGVDSDEFQRANRTMRQKLLKYIEQHGQGVQKESEEYLDFTADETRRLQVALVMEWSFQEPCTPENVLECFKNCPDIAKQVDLFAGKRAKFVSPSSENSELTQSSSSS